MNFLDKYFDEIGVGERFRSRGRTITETDIVQWCALTGDWYVLHTDAHYAAGTRFGQRIAPGLLVVAYAAGLGVPSDAPAVVANYGSNSLRFVAPTFIGDTLHLESEVLEKTVKRDGKKFCSEACADSQSSGRHVQHCPCGHSACRTA